MSFHCIACNSDKGISHRLKDAKAGNLILITCCQNCGLVQLKDVPNELVLGPPSLQKITPSSRRNRKN